MVDHRSVTHVESGFVGRFMLEIQAVMRFAKAPRPPRVVQRILGNHVDTLVFCKPLMSDEGESSTHEPSHIPSAFERSHVPTTPAPTNRSFPPDAPQPNPPAKDLPLKTPASSATPSIRPLADLSEFDPYATPAVSQASVSRQDEPVTPTPTEPAFNFSGFLKDLRTKGAEPVARYLKR